LHTSFAVGRVGLKTFRAGDPDLSGSVYHDGYAGKDYSCAEEIPGVGADSFYEPEPYERGADIDSAVGSVDASRGHGMQGEQPCEKGKTNGGGKNKPCTAALFQP